MCEEISCSSGTGIFEQELRKGLKLRIRVTSIYIFLGFFFISMAIFKGFDKTVWEDVLLYIGYLFIMIPSYLYIIAKGGKALVNKLCMIIMLWGLMSMGVLVKNIDMVKKTEVLLSYFIIVSLMVNSDEIINEPGKLKICSYAILLSLFIGFLLSLMMGIQWYTIPTEGLSYAFNAGMGHKNYVGGAALAALTGFYISNYYNKLRGYNVLMLISAILIFISGSRTVWVMMLVALFVISSRRLIRFVQSHKFFCGGLAIVLLGIGMYLMQFYSQSFYFRFMGLIDYIVKYLSDWKLFLIGNAEVVYSNERTYQLNLISAFGGMGTTEMGILNILVKSGFIGLASYLVYFIFCFKNISKTKNWDILKIGLFIMLPMVASSFSEPFIVNIKLIYTVFVWCAMSWIIRFSKDYVKEAVR